MKAYKIKLKCGHECEVELFGDEKTHAKELADCERTLECPACLEAVGTKDYKGKWEVANVTEKKSRKGRILH